MHYSINTWFILLLYLIIPSLPLQYVCTWAVRYIECRQRIWCTLSLFWHIYKTENKAFALQLLKMLNRLLCTTSVDIMCRVTILKEEKTDCEGDFSHSHSILPTISWVSVMAVCTTTIICCLGIKREAVQGKHGLRKHFYNLQWMLYVLP